MNSAEFLQQAPDFFRSHLGGSEPQWILTPPEGMDIHAGSWSFRMAATPQSVVVMKVLGNDTDEVRIMAGLAIDIPYSPQVAEYVNYLNNKMLVYGRTFAAGDIPFVGNSGAGPCVILMQEIVFGPTLSFDFTPSMESLLNVTARLAGLAHRFAPEVVERFGGRLLTDDDAAVLTLF
jgi:hypothetical protein